MLILAGWVKKGPGLRRKIAASTDSTKPAMKKW